MEQANQTMEIDNAKVVGEFYYTLALMQTKAIEYVALGETDDDKISRIISITEKFRKLISGVVDPNSGSGPCEPPCFPDANFKMCFCPHLDTDQY
ncbi:hypothetical protein BH10ACI1_BH10ACI1_18340 [soil metagenome]